MLTEAAAEIVVVRYNQPKLELVCLQSIKKHTNLRKHRLTVIDNYSSDSNLGWLWNRCVETTSQEFVCFLNSDTLVENGWLDKLIETAITERADAVGPILSHCGTIEQLESSNLDRDGTRDAGMLSGSCLLIRRSSWEFAGGFREDFPFYGADSNMMDRLGRKVIRKDVLVQHAGQGSWEDYRDFEAETSYAQETYLRNRDFDWSKKILLIGQPGHPVPVWTGVDQGLAELRRDGLTFKYIHRDCIDRADEAVDFDPDLCLVIASHEPSVRRWEPVLRRIKCPKGIWEGDLRTASQKTYLQGLFEHIFLCFGDSEEYSWGDWEQQINCPVSYMPSFCAISHVLEPLNIERRCVFIGDLSEPHPSHVGRSLFMDACNAEVLNSNLQQDRTRIEKESRYTYRQSEFCLAVQAPFEGFTSTRSYNILSYGGLLFIRHFPGIEDIFNSGQHMIAFRDTSDMLEAIDTYSGSSDLEKIRRSGRKLHQAKHNGAWRLLNMFHSLLTGEKDFWGYK